MGGVRNLAFLKVGNTAFLTTARVPARSSDVTLLTDTRPVGFHSTTSGARRTGKLTPAEGVSIVRRHARELQYNTGLGAWTHVVYIMGY